MREVDLKLIELAKQIEGKIVTNDFNLNKVAQLQGVPVLNINELANALKPVVLPGEIMRVFILKEGKEYNQGVAYLDDGTMVVVDNAKKMISKTIDISVTSVLQTTAGKMIFGKFDERKVSPGACPYVSRAWAARAGRRRRVVPGAAAFRGVRGRGPRCGRLKPGVLTGALYECSGDHSSGGDGRAHGRRNAQAIPVDRGRSHFRPHAAEVRRLPERLTISSSGCGRKTRSGLKRRSIASVSRRKCGWWRAGPRARKQLPDVWTRLRRVPRSCWCMTPSGRSLNWK